MNWHCKKSHKCKKCCKQKKNIKWWKNRESDHKKKYKWKQYWKCKWCKFQKRRLNKEFKRKSYFQDQFGYINQQQVGMWEWLNKSVVARYTVTNNGHFLCYLQCWHYFCLKFKLHKNICLLSNMQYIFARLSLGLFFSWYIYTYFFLKWYQEIYGL